MKTIIRFLLVVVSFFFCVEVGAIESEGKTPQKTSGKTVILYRKSSKMRPNAPSRVFLECSYTCTSMLFTFPESVNSISIEISNGHDEWSGYASTIAPEVVFPSKNGEYEIECTTDDGRIFTGLLCFD